VFDPCKRILERFGSNRQSAVEWIGFPQIGSRRLQKPWNSDFKQVGEDLDVWAKKKKQKKQKQKQKKVFGGGF